MLVDSQKPNTLAEVIGQKRVITFLSRIVERNDVVNLPQYFIFSGPSGVGKSVTAQLFAESLNAHVDTLDAGFLAQDDFSFTLLPKASDLKRHNVFIIENAQNLPAYSYLLLDNVLRSTHVEYTLILVVEDYTSLPLEICSRAVHLSFISLTERDMTKRMDDVVESLGVSSDYSILEQIARDSGGSLSEAFRRIDQLIHLVGKIDEQAYEEVFGGPYTELFVGLVNAMALFDLEFIQEALQAFDQHITSTKSLMDAWLTFELQVLKGAVSGFEYLNTDEGTLMRIHMLWYISGLLARTDLDPKTVLHAGVVLMSAKMTKRVLNFDDALALLG